MNKLEIQYKKTSELKPYENNPRHNEEAVKYVANSIKEFGFKVPIIIDKDNVIVAGHTRLLAAIDLGLDEVPVILADDLTEQQIKAYRIADNKVAEASGWDMTKLTEELKDLDIDVDMTDFGFSEFELSIYNDDALPDGYDDDLIDEYTQDDSELLARRRFILTYTDEQEDFIKKLLKEDKDLKVVYSAEEIMGRYE